jgi:hypothetical protein
MKPLHHTGDSSNIAYYAEPTTHHGDVWCEVLRNDYGHHKGELYTLARPVFHLTVYRIGWGEIARHAYRPRTDPGPGPLPAGVVTTMVRQAMKGRL